MPEASNSMPAPLAFLALALVGITLVGLGYRAFRLRQIARSGTHRRQVARPRPAPRQAPPRKRREAPAPKPKPAPAPIALPAGRVTVDEGELVQVLARLRALEQQNAALTEEAERLRQERAAPAPSPAPTPEPPAAPAAQPEPAEAAMVLDDLTPEPMPQRDPRSATRQALARLPRAVEPPLLVESPRAIALLSDGRRCAMMDLLVSQHWGIFGATRKGKGVLAQWVALQALALGPDAAQVWLLDPKQGLDYAFALHLAHARLYADVGGADGSLLDGYRAARDELDRRNRLMMQLQLAGHRNPRNIHEYNARIAGEGGAPLPILLVVADEVSELQGEARAILARLAGLGAGAGIVLLVMTRYPSTDEVDSSVLVNVTNRVVFGLPNESYTPVALGLRRGSPRTYEPAALTEPGIAVLRREGGSEMIGRVADLSDRVREALITHLVSRYPRPAPEAGKGAKAKRPVTVPAEERARILAAIPHYTNRTELCRELYQTDGGVQYLWVKQVCDDAGALIPLRAGAGPLVDAA